MISDIPLTPCNNTLSASLNASKYVEAYQVIDKEYVESVLNKHFDFEKQAISIINP